MRTHLKKLGVFALAASLGAGSIAALSPAEPAEAATTSVSISEVYGGGGNSRAPFNQDFIELYNLSEAPIDLAGMEVEYYSAGGNSGGSVELPAFELEPGSYYLIGAGKGANESLPAISPDFEFGANMSGSQGSVELRDADGGVLDLVGFGGASKFEGAPTPALDNSTSASRIDPAVDTDDNAADFAVGAPSPQNSSGTGSEPGPDPEPTDPPEPGEVLPISTIQGTGSSTPYAGQTVTTQGVVTGVYTGDGSKNGLFIQEPGEVDLAAHTASTGVFVYGGGSFSTDLEIGDSVQVTGTAEEYQGNTQITRPAIEALPESLGAVEPTALPEWPATDEGREVFEGMLVDPQGAYTVTDHYELNEFGTVGLAFGEGVLVTPTEVGAPGSDAAIAQAAENEERKVRLDDGQNWNYLQNNAAKNSPLPYLTPETPVTLGAPVDFTGGVIVDQFAADDAWNFQPTAPVKGTEHSPVSFGDVREQAPADVGGDITIGTFNVLNYFTDLGEDEPGCRAYPDREGNPVATNYCDVRGAYSQAAFEKQEDKIVEAINTLDASVIALEEIEDSSDFGHDRDATLEHLVDVLNEAAGEAKWEYVPSPATIPAVGDDVIRTAFIYQPAEVTYVEGSAEILENGSFTNARAPFAANFAPADEVIAENEFIVIANHLKSKGGSGSGDNASPDAQGPAWATGGWNGDRTRQAEALVDFAAELQEKHGTDLVFLTGDMNSYSMETPVTTITDAGYEHLTAGGPEYSYLFGGTVGSLDHVFASPAAAEYVTGTDIWTINAYESIALEYSRDNYNVAQLYSPDVFRSSDHNPAIIGVQFREDEEPVEATGDVHVTYFDDDIVNNAYDEGEDLRSGLLYAQNADGDWFGTGAGADGTFTLAGLPEGEYQVFLPLPNPYVSNAVFDAADGSRLPFETSTRTEGATWIDPATGEHSTFTVVERLSAVGTVSVVEDETTAVEYGLSAISAQATVVESGSDQGAQDLAELEFVDGEDTYYAHWNESIQGFNALVEEGAGTAYFLDEHVGVTVAPAEGYEVVSVTAEENGAELEVTQGASTAAADPATYTVERGELSNKNARVTFEVEVAPVEVEPTLTLTPERLTETESLEGVAYEGQGFGDGPVRIEVIDEAGEATVIEEAAEVADGAFHGTIVYRDADGTVLAMPVGTYTVRVTEGSGEDARILESTFEVVADEGEEPGPTEPGETEPGETEPGETEPGETDPGATDPGQQPGDDGDGSGKGDGGFDGDGHEGGLAQTGADGSLVILLALGAVLVLAGAGVMIQRRRA